MKAYRKVNRLIQGHNNFQFILGRESRDELQPIVFFDAGKIKQKGKGISFPFHPHSGIGIITYFEGANLVHRDSAGYDGLLKDGGVQWIRSGGGIWHQEGYEHPDGDDAEWEGAIHQLWMVLPDDLGESEAGYDKLLPEEIPASENVKVITGDYNGVKGGLELPFNMSYIDVDLKKGETFEWDAPSDQTKGMIFAREGLLMVEGTVIPSARLATLKPSSDSIKIEAAEDSKFVVILAEATQHDLVAAHGSIHTSMEAMVRSEERLDTIQRELKY